MAAPGLETFRSRNPARAGIYSFENKPRDLSPEYLRALRASRQAWAFFSAQPPWYRRTAAFWVMSAKREETRAARLAKLIESSARGERAPPFAY